MFRKIKSLLSRLISKVSCKYEREIKEDIYETLFKKDLEGCIILTHTPWQLSNLFILGKYKHSEIFVTELHTIGAETSGVNKKHIIKLLKKVDKYAILKPKFATEEDKREAMAAAELMIGLPYDFEFELDNKGMYCSELIWKCYTQATDRIPNYGKYLYPAEFLEDNESWEVIFEYEEKQ